MEEKTSTASRLGARMTAMACFCLFGALNMVSAVPKFSIVIILLGILVGFVFALITMKLMAVVISIANNDLRQQYGNGFAGQAVEQGMAYLFPFAILAFLAEYFLHWPGTMLFASAGIMTAGASVGAEIAKLGKPKMKNFILPIIVAFLMSTIWMMSTGFLSIAGGALITLFRL